MAILTAAGLGQTFGGDEIFRDIQLTLDARQRVGLVGPNGVGKTTLLRILAGTHEPSAGAVQRAAGLTLGYLRQEAVLTFVGREHSVYEEMLSVFAALREQETLLHQMEKQMAGGDGTSELLEAYGSLQESFELQGGYQYQVEIKRVLQGLGFELEQWEMPIPHLSGGQKTRLLLGRLLLEAPDLLILDEPTNHLDTAAIEWLENTLRQWPGTLILVSHDRYFLDKVVDHVWDMSRYGVTTYRGDYSSYLQQRQILWQREMELFESERARLDKEIEFVRKHIAGGKTDIAKGKLKRLTRDIVLMERAGVTGSLAALQSKSWLEIGGRVRAFTVNEAARRVRSLVPPENQPPLVNIRLQAEERSGRIVLRSGDLQIGFPTRVLFATGRLRLERLECAAIVGANGSGKTTFLRTLMGELPTVSGWFKYGDSVKLGYFAQGHDQLEQSHRVLDAIIAGREMQETDARVHAAQYQFRGDDVFKRVSDLSGGERGRLALAVLALSGANFLLLDEPTNHLDIPSQEVLQAVLERFEGTVLLVTHDRYLIDRLATQIWELKEDRLHPFKGSYQEYLMARERRALQPEVKSEKPIDVGWVVDLNVPPVGKKADTRRRRAELEAELEEVESWLERIGFEMEEAKARLDRAAVELLKDESTLLNARAAALIAELDDLAG